MPIQVKDGPSTNSTHESETPLSPPPPKACTHAKRLSEPGGVSTGSRIAKGFIDRTIRDAHAPAPARVRFTPRARLDSNSATLTMRCRGRAGRRTPFTYMVCGQTTNKPAGLIETECKPRAYKHSTLSGAPPAPPKHHDGTPSVPLARGAPTGLPSNRTPARVARGPRRALPHRGHVSRPQWGNPTGDPDTPPTPPRA